MNDAPKQRSPLWRSESRKTNLFLALCLLSVLGSRCQSEQAMNNSTENTSAQLSIALQDGFEGVPVVVRVNEKEVYHQESVQTDYRISRAASFEVPLPASPVIIEVELPKQRVRDTLRLTTDTTVYVGVSWLEGKLVFKTAERPFGYL